MKHYGDITKINGAEVPIVDVICGGSPCQDLSVAGKRAGLSGQRSGLFMDQIRIIKEMRNECIRQLQMRGADIDFRCIQPRYMVWENVPGAFSSNKGEDFRAVLEETARVIDQDAVIPEPECNKGKWSPSGCIMGDGWSIAWRVHDAQFWGVPQRRKRISLVADFGGNTAPEILFERKGVSGDLTESRKEGQAVAGNVGDSVTETGKCLNGEVVYGINGDIAGTLDANYYKGCGERQGIEREVLCVGNGGSPSCNQGGMAVAVENHPMDSRVKISEDGKVQTLSGRMGTGGGNVPMVMEPILLESNQNHATVQTNGISTSLPASAGMGGGYVPMVVESICMGNGQLHDALNPSIELSRTLNCMDDPMKVVCVGNSSVVRRLTPLECERLQGYPDHWTDIGEWTDSKGKKHKDADSPRYKALGNSIALPFWEWMAERICKQYDKPITMASLFDGIGGFPLVFSRHGATPVWASEIEEFPIAVTKIRFPEDIAWEKK